MNRSLSSDGRFYHGGNDIGSQNRRAGSMSYLSSVRSESRYRFLIPDIKYIKCITESCIKCLNIMTFCSNKASS